MNFLLFCHPQTMATNFYEFKSEAAASMKNEMTYDEALAKFNSLKVVLSGVHDPGRAAELDAWIEKHWGKDVD
jgi:hypothetical protein